MFYLLLNKLLSFKNIKDILPSIGNINWSYIRGHKPKTIDEKIKYLNISPQVLAFLVGLIDGDGNISISKSI